MFTHERTDDFLHNILLGFFTRRRDNLWIFYIQSTIVFSGSQMYGYTINNLMSLVLNFKACNVFQNNRSGDQILYEYGDVAYSEIACHREGP